MLSSTCLPSAWLHRPLIALPSLSLSLSVSEELESDEDDSELLSPTGRGL